MRVGRGPQNEIEWRYQARVCMGSKIRTHLAIVAGRTNYNRRDCSQDDITVGEYHAPAPTPTEGLPPGPLS